MNDISSKRADNSNKIVSCLATIMSVMFTHIQDTVVPPETLKGDIFINEKWVFVNACSVWDLARFPLIY